MSVFDQIGGVNPKRSAFDLSHRLLFTGDMGYLYPIMSKLMIPGDVFKIGSEVLVDFQPLIRPFRHEVNVYVHYFAVPLRLLWDEWEDFITGGESGTLTPAQPRWGAPTRYSYRTGYIMGYVGISDKYTIGGSMAD